MKEKEPNASEQAKLAPQAELGPLWGLKMTFWRTRRPLGSSVGVPQETQVDPLEPCEASGELSWGALGATGRRLGAQKETKGVPMVLKDAKWRPFKNSGKTKQISPFGILRSILRAPRAVQKASEASS